MAIATVRAAGADPCAPTAVVTGEPELVTEVEQTLSERGVSTRVSGECPFVRAEVAMLGSEILTSIDDGDGRHSERVMASPQVAATLIESWTRSDLAVDLLGPATPIDLKENTPAVEEPPAAAASSGVLASETVSPEPTAAEPWAGWLGASGEATAGSNRSTAFGARAGVCWRTGPACIGGLVRFGYDPGLTGNSRELQTVLTSLDGLLLFDFPLEWSRVSLTPGLGIGGGWSRSSRFIEDEDDDFEGEQSGENDDANEKDGQVDEDQGGLRLDAHALLAISLIDDLSLEVTLSVGLSAFGNYGAYNYDDAHVAGEPRGSLRGGVGLGYRF